jgi:23S rRNA (cytosine1962-C5)-methyltransferase
MGAEVENGSMGPRIVLKPGHVKPVWAGHPWVYAQAVARLDGSPEPGGVVEVLDPNGNWLGRGFWSPESAIPVRLVTRDPEEPLDEEALARRIAAAARRRQELLGLPNEETTGFRLVHAEGDGLPGLVVDRYGEVLAAQLLTLGLKLRQEAILEALASLPGVESVVEIADREAARLEGFSAETRTARGPVVETLAFQERGFQWRVPLALGQKTGFYFDQRENRARVESLAAGRRVLDAYCYLGSFALAAARGGAREVVAVDSSSRVLETARGNARANGWGEAVDFRRLDARRHLRELGGAGTERFDLVILDPPKLAPTARHLPEARKVYEGLNAAALALVAPGGLLVTCSCSAAMGGEELLRAVAIAAKRARREVTLLHLGGQAPDHPTPPAFAEGRYLQCAFLAVGSRTPQQQPSSSQQA